jgi:hypothetical protein
MSNNKNKEINDPRFNKVFSNPIFQEVPKKIRKIEVKDERFKGMFKDKRFNDKLDIDEYGRAISNLSKIILEKKDRVKNDLKKYYMIDDEDQEDEAVSDEEEIPELVMDVDENNIIADEKQDYIGEGDGSDTSEEFDQFLKGI